MFFSLRHSPDRQGSRKRENQTTDWLIVNPDPVIRTVLYRIQPQIAKEKKNKGVNERAREKEKPRKCSLLYPVDQPYPRALSRSHFHDSSTAQLQHSNKMPGRTACHLVV